MTELKKRNGYYFMPNGLQDPGVTTVLGSVGSSFGLTDWAAGHGGMGVALEASKRGAPISPEEAKEIGISCQKNELDRTASFGKNVHSGIESRLKRGDYDRTILTTNEVKALVSFDNFYDDVGFDPELVEFQVHSVEGKFAGRLDMAVNVNEEQSKKLNPYLVRTSDPVEPGLIIADIKTGSAFRDKIRAQLGAYMVAYEEMYSKSIKGGLLIHIKREKPDEVKCFYWTRKDLEEGYDGFMKAYEAWKFFDAPVWWKRQYMAF